MTLRQPFLHDLAVVLRAPTQVWSAPNGDVDGSGVQGAFFGDHRVLRGLGVDVQDAEGAVELASAGASLRPDGSVDFHTVVRWQDGTADPLGALTRHRVARPGGFGERIVISASLPRPIEVTLTLRLVPDNTPLNLIKAGVEAARPVTLQGNGWTFGVGASATLDAPAATIEHDEAITLRWRLTLPAFGQVAAQWSLALRDPATPFVGSAAAPLAAPALTNASSSLARLVAQSLADLSSLRLCERNEADRTFFAAGAPWFLTLFGRDSLIAARLLLPADTEMAVGTLRTLAGRQGTAVDVDRAEQPGKILHEVRAATLDLQQGTVLPPEYYGTVDATPLWVLLLADAVAAGVDPVAEGLMDGLHGALTWLRDHSDPDGDGFAEYYDTSGHGLANQGWKDSGDSIRFADGRGADGPIALVEVQGYCYAAAIAGAELLARFADDPAGAAFWRDWAARLKARFDEQFWVSDAHGRYPALALDRQKNAVTGVASNMGHLLGTGLLDADQEALVVSRLMSPEMFSGYGIRTMSTDNVAYWPTRYHVGSVWTHDTAMIIDGMLRAGFDAPARTLAEGLLRAAEGFDYRLPELFGGQSADEVFPPLPYPASCRPQAWAAASGITVARALGAL